MNENEIVLYQPNELTKLEVRVENETVWLTQEQIAQLFGTRRPAITKHLNNIYASGELDKESTCSILEHMGNDGKQLYRTTFYNLDAILSVGYRVNSVNATHFRRWATTILKDYLLRGYAINQRLLAMEERIDYRLTRHEQILTEHQNKIDFFVRTSLPPMEGVFYDGQIFDAYVFVSDLVKSATKAIHDRFLIIDETVYHIGASIKDLGKRLFAFSKMEMGKDVVLERV